MTCELRGPTVSFNKKYKKKRTQKKRTQKKRTQKKRTKRTKKQTKKRINKIKKRVKKTNQIIQKGGDKKPCMGLNEGGAEAAQSALGKTSSPKVGDCNNMYYHPEDLLGWGRTGAWYVGNSWTKATFQGSEGTNSEPYRCPQCAYFNDWAERHPSPPRGMEAQVGAAGDEALEAVPVIDVVNNPHKYYPPKGVGPFVFNPRMSGSKERNKGEEGNMQVRKIKGIVANPAAAVAAEHEEFVQKCRNLFHEAQDASEENVPNEVEDALWDKYRSECPGGIPTVSRS
jgi:hypothetical protein